MRKIQLITDKRAVRSLEMIWSEVFPTRPIPITLQTYINQFFLACGKEYRKAVEDAVMLEDAYQYGLMSYQHAHREFRKRRDQVRRFARQALVIGIVVYRCNSKTLLRQQIFELYHEVICWCADYGKMYDTFGHFPHYLLENELSPN